MIVKERDNAFVLRYSLDILTEWYVCFVLRTRPPS
jgi:hypothetical protein